MVLRGEVYHALKVIMLACGVTGLGQSIGVNQQAVRIVEREAMTSFAHELGRRLNSSNS